MNLLQSENSISVIQSGTIIDKLPVANYLLKYNSQIEHYWLERIEDFSAPKKMYGDCSEMERWKTSWESDDRNLGILLRGIKGSGKTMFAKEFCRRMNMPVIIIAEQVNFESTSFLQFMSNPSFNNSIVFFDEYDKIMKDHEHKHSLLPLLDGSVSSKYIFVITVNDDSAISKYMTNRMNRVKYCKSFDDLDSSIIEEVIEDKLENKANASSVRALLDIIKIKTYDLLVNIINEMNLFNEDALTCAKYLNLRQEQRQYAVHEIIDGKEMYSKQMSIDFKIKGSNVELEDDYYISLPYGVQVPNGFNAYVEVENTKVEVRGNEVHLHSQKTNRKFVLRVVSDYQYLPQY